MMRGSASEFVDWGRRFFRENLLAGSGPHSVWAAASLTTVLVVEDAVRNLDGALDRRQRIEALLVAARAAVEEHKAAFKNVKGAPTISRKNKSKRLNADVLHLERGFLPGEVAEIPQAPPGTLMASPEGFDGAKPTCHTNTALRCCSDPKRKRGQNPASIRGP